MLQVSYAESLLLGDPFDFLTNVPAIKMMMSVPSLSCCRQVYRSRMARRLMQRYISHYHKQTLMQLSSERTLVIGRTYAVATKHKLKK